MGIEMASMNQQSRVKHTQELRDDCVGKRALVIDNDATAALGLSVALERLGVSVVAEISRIEESVDYPAEIVCCDLVLSREGRALQGAAGVAELVSQGRNILALSSVARANEVGDVIGVGALGFIDRDNLDWGDFGIAVGDISGGQRHLSRSLAARLLSDINDRPLPGNFELSQSSKHLLEELFAKGDEVLRAIPTQDLVAITSQIWSTWSRRTIRYRLNLSERHLELLRRFHDGASPEAIAKAMNVSIGTVHADQDRIKAVLLATYGKDLRREAACRLVWQLVDGQLRWGIEAVS
ncbi:hypothetical protein AXFE_28750 [Acidithrix ferrooxidans]|uniref:Uncharacterized protein n=2 Tax=Acidithrix ferrooxidans TaxID=1280514 RepID=A0A0D8HEF7_9ACTN|nr:hypothetical protein AXFE_28750 [Acidithrix ferrooxidans]